MNVGVVGCGYVGLVTGLGMASLGHRVVGVELDDARRERIARGESPFHEPGVPERLTSCLAEQRFRVTGDLADLAGVDVTFLCVQTPSGADGALDVQYLVAAARQLAGLFTGDERRRVVVVRSTVAPGTTEQVVAPIFADLPHVSVAANPEFLREGSALEDFQTSDRVVIGSLDDWAGERLAELYAPLDSPIIRTTPATAELVKCTSNSLLATLISFSNEIAHIAEAHPGVDVEQVMDILHMDGRLTPVVDGRTVSPGILSYLRPSCGFGGSCLPKDVNALRAHAIALGEPSALLEAVTRVNRSQPERVIAMVEHALGGLDGNRVAVLGVAFKAGTDDIRESAGLRMVDLLLDAGAIVTVYDPLVAPSVLDLHAELGVEVCASLEEAIAKAEACVVTTTAPEFHALESGSDAPDRSLVVVDGRRSLSPASFGAGRYLAVGRGPVAG